MSNSRTRRNTRLIAGAGVVAFVFAFSRWGTNIGIPPVYICDVLIFLILAHAFITRASTGSDEVNHQRPATVSAWFSLLFAYFVARWALSVNSASPLDTLRDGMPFAYGMLAFLAASSVAHSTGDSQARTLRLLRWALTVHLIWVSLVLFGGASKGIRGLPLTTAPVFEVRPDIDVALIAVAAAFNLRQAILGRRRIWNLAGLLLALVTVSLHTATRAGQVSLIAALLVSYVLTFDSLNNSSKRLMLAFGLPVIAGIALTTIPLTTAGQRMIASISPSYTVGSIEVANARGTQEARRLVWQGVIHWTNESPIRAIFGSGFGNNFLAQSNTLTYLEGTTYTNVRSPHNWFIGVYARLGLVGLILLLFWLIQLIGEIWRDRILIARSDFQVLAVLVLVAILPVASLGVVLEAPFGAIPFFWACGVLMGSRSRVSSRRAGASSRGYRKSQGAFGREHGWVPTGGDV